MRYAIGILFALAACTMSATPAATAECPNDELAARGNACGHEHAELLQKSA